jgi:hypothetical protein
MSLESVVILVSSYCISKHNVRVGHQNSCRPPAATPHTAATPTMPSNAQRNTCMCTMPVMPRYLLVTCSSGYVQTQSRRNNENCTLYVMVQRPPCTPLCLHLSAMLRYTRPGHAGHHVHARRSTSAQDLALQAPDGAPTNGHSAVCAPCAYSALT